MSIEFDLLGNEHDRRSFHCGDAKLDDWFQRRSGQDQRRNIANVFVARDESLGIVGFYSLSSFTLELDDVPPEIASKLPRYGKVPTALIGRLARDERVRGKGMGELLLADAIKRIIGASRTIAVFAIVVDAKDANASNFYETFGFRPLPLHPTRLFLLTSTAVAALTKA